MEHGIVRDVKGDHNRWILASLAFVNRCGIGQAYLIELIKIVDNRLTIKSDPEFFLFPDYLLDLPQVSVEYPLVVVVP